MSDPILLPVSLPSVPILIRDEELRGVVNDRRVVEVPNWKGVPVLLAKSKTGALVLCRTVGPTQGVNISHVLRQVMGPAGDFKTIPRGAAVMGVLCMDVEDFAELGESRSMTEVVREFVDAGPPVKGAKKGRDLNIGFMPTLILHPKIPAAEWGHTFVAWNLEGYARPAGALRSLADMTDPMAVMESRGTFVVEADGASPAFTLIAQ